MLLFVVLFSLASRTDGAQVSLQFTRTTHSNGAWKLPSFTKSGRYPRPDTQTISSLLLQVRGGSDNRGDPSNRYYYDDNDSYSQRRPYNDKVPERREEKKVDEYYYGEQDGNYYEEDRRYEKYDDRGRRDDSPGLSSAMPSIIKHGDRKIGMALLAGGAFFTISGVFLFFHKTLLRLGNLLFIAGVPMTIGPGRTAGYFFQPRKARATAFLAFGIFLVFVGWPILGMALEIFGLLNLFGNMIPVAMVVLGQLPIVGPMFKSLGGGNKRRKDDRDDDRYYNDDRYRDDRYRDDRYNDDRYYGDDDKGGDGYY